MLSSALLLDKKETIKIYLFDYRNALFFLLSKMQLKLTKKLNV